VAERGITIPAAFASHSVEVWDAEDEGHGWEDTIAMGQTLLEL
jgi:hypothetical protein